MTAQEILDKNKKVFRLMLRLDESVRNADEQNKRSKEKLKENSAFKAITFYPEHYKILIKINGVWESNGKKPNYGGSSLKDDLIEIISEGEATAIKVDITGGKTSSNIKDTTTIYIEGAEKITPKTEPTQPENLQGLGELLSKQMETALATIKDPNSAQIQLATAGFEKQIMQMQHQQQIASLQKDFEYQLRDKEREYKEQIDGLNEEIEELQNQINDQDSALAGVQEKLENKEKNKYWDLLINIGAGIGTKILIENPKILSLTGASDEAVKEVVEGMAKKANQLPASETPAQEEPARTFENAGAGIDLSHLPQAQQNGINALINFFKEIPEEHFLAVFSVMVKAQNPDGTLNSEKINTINDLLN